MPLLYEILESSAGKAIAVHDVISGQMPMIFTATLDVVYMGEVEDIITVEIKNKASELGWLYGSSAVVLYHHGGKRYECRLSNLRTLAEFRLKEKRYLLQDQPNTPGCIRLESEHSGRVVGYVQVEEVIKVSNEIIHEDQ
jgi:hypothetical protein